MGDRIPRLVATDLDGTIVRSDGTVSIRTVAALARVERAGATLVLVTGRPPRWMGEIADRVAHHGLAICANGAVVYDLHSEEVVEARLIDPETIGIVVDRLRTAVPEFRFAVEYPDGFVVESAPDLAWDPETMGGRFVDGSALAHRPGTKLLAFAPRANPDRLMERAEKAVGDLVTVTRSSSGGLIEMSAQGVTKASALADLCASRGVGAAEVVAFGDMPNDLPMLTWAGRPYAVANAHPDVLAAVPGRTASNDEDGVAQILESLYPA